MRLRITEIDTFPRHALTGLMNDERPELTRDDLADEAAQRDDTRVAGRQHW
jgi:hypothetical protein